jgi:hypothetical protein
MRLRRRRRTIRYDQTPRPPPRRRATVLVVALSGAVLVAWLLFTMFLHWFA